MDRFAEKLARWFGSTVFILLHAMWFGGWVVLHFAVNFDPEWSALTVIVSLEAIFLSLFILRAERTQHDQLEKDARRELTTRRVILEKLKK